MPALTKRSLHERIVASSPTSDVDGDIDAVPLLLNVPGVAIPLAIWAFTLTNPPGGRHPAESKIQIIAPGQDRHDRGNFVGPVGYFKLLIGVHPEEDLFVLWDAYKQQDFSWSKNVQVQGTLLWDASVSGLSRGTRLLVTGNETVIVAHGDRLMDAIHERIEI